MSAAHRVLAVAAAAVALAAAGCGSSPEDQARNDGKSIGRAVYDLQSATSPQDAAKAVDTIRSELQDVRAKVPSGYAQQLQNIASDLRSSVQSAQDPAAIRAAIQDARSQLNSLQSDTNSVVNELRRGIREGYDDAAG